MKQRFCIIAGTGMEPLAEDFRYQSSSEIRSDTPWGQVPIRHLSHEEVEIFLIDRHHSDLTGKRTPPHNINYRANIHAAKSLDPDLIISVNSVGTMVEDFPPGSVGLVSDVLDLSSRPMTFFDDVATHADRTSCFSEYHMEKIKQYPERGLSTFTGIVSAQSSGPQFETPAEITALRALGAHVVGMTLGPESRLISEIGVPHIALCCSSNWAAGQTPNDPYAPIDHEIVSSQASATRSILVGCIECLFDDVKS
ncbi:MAG: MTAP family purine nucleoside phosphorylase [Candidatus Thermoplasmatota archaeon]|nr:MTAP family purine nucleoside phosphorylase [Candidatus Thermoplasmatota archaeon]MEC8045771.1 MTAP family purine nucleoside phosphorylase [Candidatus Thermoplasmatota archaeon]MEC9137270.1 MTAP family purine nucleoside phosphorylase [Candidatus Thermoplasmatota archaeon]